MDTFAAQRVAELKDGPIGWVAPMSGERSLIGRPAERMLQVVDSLLRPIWRLNLPSPWDGGHAVAEDLSRVALSLQHEVVLLTGEGEEVSRLSHSAWSRGASETGCCAFAPDQPYLWATAPTEEQSDELWLIQVDDGVLVDRRRLNAWAAGCEPVFHPDGRTIGLSIGEGQDGSLIRWASAEKGRIRLRVPQTIDRVLVDIHPSGKEYLSTPHGNTEADDLVRHRFDDDAPVASLSAWDAFPFGGEWDLAAGYLTEDLILAGVEPGERQVLVKREPMAVLGTISYPNDEGPGWLVSARSGSWLTLNDEALIRWSLPYSGSSLPIAG